MSSVMCRDGANESVITVKQLIANEQEGIKTYP